LANNSRIAPAIPLAKKHTATLNIDDSRTRDSRRIIPAFVFRFSLESISKESFGVRSKSTYVSDKDIEVTGQPIQTEIIPILKK